jgi:TrkA domain protein
MGKDDLSLRMEIVKIAEKSKLDGNTLRESNIRLETGGAMVTGLIRDKGKTIPNPSGDMKLLGGDQLLVLGTPEQIEKLVNLAS